MPYCICAHIQVVANRTPVLVLQHPDEHKHPMNTARLAMLGLARAECWVGLAFPMLAQRLAAAQRPALLFPGPGARTPQQWLKEYREGMNTFDVPTLVNKQATALKIGVATHAEAATTTSAKTDGVPTHELQICQHSPDLLVVPDGTWRQAGRLVRGNPVLEALPRLALDAGAASRYRVRRAGREAAVSTIEAIVRTLSALEPGTDFQPVLRPFEAMVDGQIRAMGEQAYERHLALTARRTAED